MNHSIEVTSNEEVLSHPPSADNINEISNPPRKTLATSRLFRSKKKQNAKAFIEAVENDLFNPTNI